MVDEAIRYLTKLIRLPGEAQQIDRILEKFARSYHIQNPTLSFTAEALYILFFSLIMLNTDLHNKSIATSRKMTLEQYISNLRGINSGSNVSKQLLTSLYNRIKNNPLVMNDEDMYESPYVEFMAPAKVSYAFYKCNI